LTKDEISKRKFNEMLLLLVLAAIQFTHIVDFVIIMPLGPSFMKVFSITPKEFGLIVSSYTFSAGFFSLLSAAFVDKFDRKYVLNVSYIGFIIGTLCCAIAPNYYYLIVARIVAGAFGGVVGACVLSIVGDLIPYSRRGRATGIIMSAFSLATVAGVPIGLKISSLYGWNAPFWILSGFSAVILILSIIYLPNVTIHLKSKLKLSVFEKYFNVVKDPNHLWAFFLTAMMMFAGFSVIPFISPFAVRNAGVSEKDLAYIYFLGGAFTLITSRIIGFMTDRYGKQRIFILLALCSIVPLLAITNLFVMPLWQVLVVSTVFMIFVSGRFIPAMSMITATVHPENRGAFMSLNSFVQQIASGLASTSAGLIIGETVTGKITNYWMVGILASLSSIICIFISKKLKVVDNVIEVIA
jgi:predicted MFS family arabinose efflux permease